MKKLLLLLLLPALISCGNDQKSKEDLENNPETDSLETGKEMEFKVLEEGAGCIRLGIIKNGEHQCHTPCAFFGTKLGHPSFLTPAKLKLNPPLLPSE